MPRVRMEPTAADTAVDDSELEAAGLLGDGLPGAPSGPAPARGSARSGEPQPAIRAHAITEEILPAVIAKPAVAKADPFVNKNILFGNNRNAMARDRFLKANAKLKIGLNLNDFSTDVQVNMAPEQRELRKIRELFDSMDEDLSGALNQSEIQTLVRSMGDRMSTAQITTAMSKMDPEMTSEVSFERFVKWWKYKKQEYRRDLAKRVEEVFKIVDSDGSGELEKNEVKQIYSKVLKALPGTIEFFPAFDLEEDFALMQAPDLRSQARKQQVIDLTDAHNEGHVVNYDEFVAWFKFRTGDDDPTLPVLPEYICTKIAALSPLEKELMAQPQKLKRSKSGRYEKRSGAELWDFLRPRLKLLVKLQAQWGSMHDVYGTHNVSLFENTQVPANIRDPDSAFSETWDVVQMVLLLYVAYAVPARTAFDIATPIDNIWFWVDVCVDLYFITDCFLSFRTAYWAPNGVLEVGAWPIADNYMRGWFFIDFASSLPVNYVLLFIVGQEEAAKYRILRCFRLFRLLRLARIKRLVQRYQDSFDLGPYMGLMGTLASILFAAHMMACTWYFIGTEGVQRVDGDQNPIWECADGSSSHLCGGSTFAVDADGQKYAPDGGMIYGWAQTDKLFGGYDDPKGFYNTEQLSKITLGTRYIRSMFNIFEKNIGPGTTMENTFAVLSELVHGFIYGGLAGVISSLMMSSNAGEQEYVMKMVALKSWMKSKKMTKRHRMKILAHFNTQQENGTFFDEEEILGSLPPTLSSELSFHMYKDVVEALPIFKGLGQEVAHHLCQIMKPLRVMKDQIIYEEGTVGTAMYVVIEGEVEVSLGGERLGFLSKGAFFGETPVIETVTEKGGDGTEVRTRSVSAVIDTNLAYVESTDIIEVLDKYPELKIRLSTFEKIGKVAGNKGNNKAEMAKMRVAALMVTAEAAKLNGSLVQSERLEDAPGLIEVATVAMEDAKRSGANAAVSLDLWQEANKALEDALGITDQKEDILKLINAALRASGKEAMVEAGAMLLLPLRTLEKEASDAGVEKESVTAVLERRKPEARPAPPAGDATQRKPAAPRAEPSPKGGGGGDNKEILSLLRAMKVTQDRLVADVAELKSKTF